MKLSKTPPPCRIFCLLFAVLLPAILGFAPSYRTACHINSHTTTETSKTVSSSWTFSSPLVLHSSVSSHPTGHQEATGDDDTSDDDDSNGNPPLRSRLRKITGFSLTALRKTVRGATGISLTAVYASTVAVTGAWIRQTMKFILSVFPAWARYFVQPFLVLYYAPLFILRNLTGPTRKRARQSHEHFVDGWKDAVEMADKKSSNWPVHLSEDGDLEKDSDEVDMNSAIAESVEVAMEGKEAEAKK